VAVVVLVVSMVVGAVGVSASGAAARARPRDAASLRGFGVIRDLSLNHLVSPTV